MLVINTKFRFFEYYRINIDFPDFVAKVVKTEIILQIQVENNHYYVTQHLL
ncbi:hypothetical protein SAMN05444483_1177 [Salegentibacter echinorum]|uniref:Uncharacterized protein n=1 Tax=Salegentibacter echinorum TaxID=1073325 RepID=A0A1M5KX94_SALEC|nr:hypothetical protein SAMN05444483_1177 [Salegentibacter echinorum]